jgi:hypothetical protein
MRHDDGPRPARDPKSNYKFLSGDVVHDKSLVVLGKKHLQEELDRSLRHGFPTSGSLSP